MTENLHRHEHPVHPPSRTVSRLSLSPLSLPSLSPFLLAPSLSVSPLLSLSRSLACTQARTQCIRSVQISQPLGTRENITRLSLPVSICSVRLSWFWWGADSCSKSQLCRGNATLIIQQRTHMANQSQQLKPLMFLSSHSRSLVYITQLILTRQTLPLSITCFYPLFFSLFFWLVFCSKCVPPEVIPNYHYH